MGSDRSEWNGLGPRISPSTGTVPVVPTSVESRPHRDSESVGSRYYRIGSGGPSDPAVECVSYCSRTGVRVGESESIQDNNGFRREVESSVPGDEGSCRSGPSSRRSKEGKLIPSLAHSITPDPFFSLRSSFPRFLSSKRFI